jgi:hypothetical protein
MQIFWSCALLALVGPAAPARAAEPGQKGAKEAPKTYQIPYKTTIPKHIVVRAKINGKGPFNFILDTGAPLLFLATTAAKKAGVKADKDGWATPDRIDIEGGLRLPKTRVRVETPFQLEGMNGMGLAGVELHGMIGYNVLAHYRMQIDFTRDKMAWTALDYKPEIDFGKRRGGGGAGGGLEMMGSLMKGLGGMLGRKPAPAVQLRGFLGLTLGQGEEFPLVEAVLGKGPAGRAGLQKGDLITRVNGRSVAQVIDVLKHAGGLPPGGEVKLTVLRGKESKTITFKTGEGI